MRTIVTGATGFIGANIVRRLLAEGREVLAVDNSSRGSPRNLEGLAVETAHADLRSYEEASHVVKEADSIFHLAARVGGITYLHETSRSELEALQSNLAIDANVFRAVREAGIGKVVYASSVSVYPIGLQGKLGTILKEDDFTGAGPEGGYGWAKLVGEAQLQYAEGTKSAAARIFNAYGEFSEYGATAQVIPALIVKAIRYPMEDFIVWGDGHQTRNPLYIGDCVDALMAMEKSASYPPLVLNVGNPTTCTIKEIAEEVLRASGKRLNIRFDPTKPVGPLSRIPDVSKAMSSISWRPRVELSEGIARTYRWIADQIGLASNGSR